MAIGVDHCAVLKSSRVASDCSCGSVPHPFLMQLKERSGGLQSRPEDFPGVEGGRAHMAPRSGKVSAFGALRTAVLSSEVRTTASALSLSPVPGLGSQPVKSRGGRDVTEKS